MLNEEITKAQYRSNPDERSVKKDWDRHFKKHGGDYCVTCLFFEKLRLYRYCSGFFNEIKENDTIYIIEDCSAPYNNYFLTIWNRIDTASFSAGSVEKILQKRPGPYSSLCGMQLVGKWDIKGIRYEEKMYSKGIRGGAIYYATRVIVKRNKYKIDCIRYNQFNMYERDKWDTVPAELRPKNLPECGCITEEGKEKEKNKK